MQKVPKSLFTAVYRLLKKCIELNWPGKGPFHTNHLRALTCLHRYYVMSCTPRPLRVIGTDVETSQLNMKISRYAESHLLFRVFVLELKVICMQVLDSEYLKVRTFF